MSSQSLSDRSLSDSVSIGSNDICIEDHRDDKFCKQKRRGSGLGGIATYFKSNIAKVRHGNKDGIPSQVSSEESTDHSTDFEKGKTLTVSERSPFEFLDVMWRARGYGRDLYSTLDTAYFNQPSPLQIASYHTRVLEWARENKIEEIRSVMASGVSSNPSNEEGHSLMHEICLLGFHDLLGVLVNEFQADVQISDSSGRTPLHEACVGGPAGPFFAVVDILARKDHRMFSLKDDSGKTPLHYVPMDHWGAWIDYLYIRRDTYWPRRLVKVDGDEEPPALALEKPNSRLVADPLSPQTIDLANELVAGDMTPEQVSLCRKKGSEENSEGTATDDSCSSG